MLSIFYGMIDFPKKSPRKFVRILFPATAEAASTNPTCLLRTLKNHIWTLNHIRTRCGRCRIRRTIDNFNIVITITSLGDKVAHGRAIRIRVILQFILDEHFIRISTMGSRMLAIVCVDIGKVQSGLPNVMRVKALYNKNV